MSAFLFNASMESHAYIVSCNIMMFSYSNVIPHQWWTSSWFITKNALLIQQKLPWTPGISLAVNWLQL